MKCPICKTADLTEHDLPDGPPSHRCAQCGGQWVESKRYWAWIESPDRVVPPIETGEASFTVVDSVKAKICPECGHLLTRAKVGHGVNFHLDRCASCGGIWFDALEWESLRARGLHDDVHYVFSKTWQSELARVERQRQREKLLRDRIGDADFTEIQRVKAWLDGHAHRAELYAVLMAEIEAAPAMRRAK